VVENCALKLYNQVKMYGSHCKNLAVGHDGTGVKIAEANLLRDADSGTGGNSLSDATGNCLSVVRPMF
jgi:hypothetical protein